MMDTLSYSNAANKQVKNIEIRTRAECSKREAGRKKVHELQFIINDITEFEN